MERQPHRTQRERAEEAERRKQLLAKTILVRIRYELSQHPDTEEFTYPMKSSLGKLERFVLSHYAWEIADRIRADHSVALSLDESVEPPILTVSLGHIRTPKH